MLISVNFIEELIVFIQLLLVKISKQSAYISKNIYTVKTESTWLKPNYPDDIIEELIVFIPLFVAEIYEF